MRDRLSICNAALAELPASAIPNLSDRSREAVECARAYPAAFADVLAHPWRWNAAMALLVETPSDRDEWGVCYELPANFGGVRRLAPSGFTGRAFAHAGWADGHVPHDIIGTRLYANLKGLHLEYSRNDVTEANMPAPIARYLELLLASRIVMPITKNRARQQEIRQDVELTLQRAIAWDMSQVPHFYGDAPPGTDAAWHGTGTGYRPADGGEWPANTGF